MLSHFSEYVLSLRDRLGFLQFCLHASTLNLKLTDFMVDYFMTISSLCQLAEVCRGNGAGPKQASSTDTVNDSGRETRKPQKNHSSFSLIRVICWSSVFWIFFIHNILNGSFWFEHHISGDDQGQLSCFTPVKIFQS